MRSQVQVLAGPPLFSQLRALPPPGRSHPLPAWAASGPHAFRAVAPKALPEQATQRPSHDRPHAGDHVPDDLRAAMPQVGEPGRVPGSLPTSGPCPTGSSWSARRSSLAAGRDLPTTTAKPTPPFGPARPAPALSVRLRLGQTTSRSWIPCGATTPTPAVLAASARLTNSPGSDTADAGTPG
jgi:hypothetical protein